MKNRIWVMVAESRVYCSTCDKWFLSDTVDYKDIKSNCHGEDVMVFRCEICGKHDESVVVLTNAPKADVPTLTRISDNAPIVFPEACDPHIKMKRHCLELNFDNSVADDQFMYEFTDEWGPHRVEINLSAGTVSSIVIWGVPQPTEEDYFD